MKLQTGDNQKKLETLAECEGFDNVTDMLREASGDSVNPGICIHRGCDYTWEVEPDRREGHREACGTRTVQAALVLAELI